MKKIKYLLILFVLFPLSLLAQQTVISGKVIDFTDGNSLPGVSVRVRGTNIGTVTDKDGKFSIGVSSNDATLLISYIGYLSQEAKIADLKNGIVALRTSSKDLDE